MKNILTENLENEMDLILAHKRVMKLSELCGLSLPVQTIFATAVSEIARVAIEKGSEARLLLGISLGRGNRKQIQAVISDRQVFCNEQSESIQYARRLADEVSIEAQQPDQGIQVVLRHGIPLAGLLNDTKILSFVEYFKNERPLSPYDELRRKNIQLEEMARRLQESENNYTQLTNSLPLMMFSVHQSGKITYTNKWLRDFLGFDVSYLSAVQCQPFVYPEDYEDMYKRWNKAKDGQDDFHGQVRLKHMDSGEYIWHLISILPLRTDRRMVEQWNGFLVDIHAQKLVEETLKDNSELRAAQQQLKYYQHNLENKIVALHRSNHDLKQFAYIASHDLQEPVRKIRTFISVIQHHDYRQEIIEKYFSKIDKAADRMLILIKGVLDYSRLSSEEPVFEPIDLNKLLKQVEDDFEDLILQKGALLEVHALPHVSGQSVQLRQLFSNLLSNALKFTPKDPVIRVSALAVPEQDIASLPELKPGIPYVLISFKDNGIGFEQQYNEKIFSIFKQLNPRDTYEGTGIGLALCRKVVERHHGYITANSNPGEGTTFKIYLPLSQP